MDTDTIKNLEKYFGQALRNSLSKTKPQGETKYLFGVTQDDINEYIEKSKTNENTEGYKKYANVSDRLISDISSDFDLTGYVHALRDNDIRHIFNSHGEKTNEKYPVTEKDIELIPYIVENYDKVFYNKHNGNNSIIYVKVSNDGITYYVEQATDKYGNENLLVNKQMIKTGLEDIPSAYKNAINKKEELSKFLADLEKIHEEYAQSDVGYSSADIIRTNDEKSQEKFSDRASMTEDRIDYLIEDSGAGNRTDYAQSWITSINPTEFLNMTLGEKYQNRELFDKVPGDYGTTVNEYDYIDGLKKETRQTPFLMIDVNTGEVIGHEGRHRMRALEKAGITSAEIKVQFYDDGSLVKQMNGDGNPLEIIDSFKIYNQRGTGQSATIENIIPLNKQNRDAIIQSYGKENSKIRYSVPNDFDSALEAYDNGEISRDEFREIANEEYGEKLNEYGAIPTGEKSGNDPIAVPKSVDGKSKNKRFVRTVIEKKDLTQNMIEELGTSILKGEMSYTPTSLDSLVKEAREKLEDGTIESFWNEGYYKNSFSPELVAAGEVLLQQAIDEHDTKRVLELTAQLSSVFTLSGQISSSARILKNLGGAGKLYVLQKQVNKLQNDINKGRRQYEKREVLFHYA